MPALSFGERNFGAADLGDRRRVRRWVQTADLLLRHPGGSLPDKLSHPAALQGLYRWVSRESVTQASVLGPHYECVRQRIAAAAGDVVLLQDTTELDYSGLSSRAEELGTLGGPGRPRGFPCHPSRAVAAGSHEGLGRVSQILPGRANVPRPEPRRTTRAKPERESRGWQRGCEASPAPSANQRLIDRADRASDRFEFLEFEQTARRR